ncbi:MAG: hypothetical protein RL175_1359 [Pseudomonadota bacterium]|jgi:hypothetical protein
MKVLDLQCGQHHVFEGWFASEEDFQSQLTRGLVACPLCGDAQVAKKLSAPRLNLSTSRGEREASGNETTNVNAAVSDATTPPNTSASPALPSLQDVANLEPAQLQAALLKMVRHVVATTEDVGESFPEEARKMHYGEAEHRNIRGHATPEETEALIEEGIAVMPLPLPHALKEPLQ